MRIHKRLHRHRRADRQDRRVAPAPRPARRRRHRTEDAAGLTVSRARPARARILRWTRWPPATVPPTLRRRRESPSGRRPALRWRRRARSDRPGDRRRRKIGRPRLVRMVRSWGLPEAVLAALVTLWSVEFIRLPMLRYDKFGTFGFDLGIYDQGTWLLSRGKDPFVTIRGLELFGHHANIFLLLLVPFYWLGAGPIFLLVVQVLAQASGAIAIFLLARDLLRSKWAGVALAAALAAQPDLPVAHVGVLPPGRGRDRTAALRVLDRTQQALGVVHVRGDSHRDLQGGSRAGGRGARSRHPPSGRPASRRDRRGRVDDLLLLRDARAHPGRERDRALLRQLLR